MGFKRFSLLLAGACALLCGAVSCLSVDTSLGSSFIPESEIFVTRTFTVPIDSILVREIDSLSAYSSQRITIGAIRDDVFGLTRRSSAFSFVPLCDTLIFGTNPRNIKFKCHIECDTVSCASADQADILQNIRVYPLRHAIDSTYIYSCQLKVEDFAGEETITKGTPVYSGKGNLNIEFNEEFARSYIDEGRMIILDTIDNYVSDHPGIFICTDDPIAYGGRLDFLKVALDYDSDHVIYGNYAELSFTSDMTDEDGILREGVDTAYFFSFGATTNDENASYYAFNCAEHEGLMGKSFLAEEYIPVEGGTGLKPVIKASHLRNLVKKAVSDTLLKYGLDPEKEFMSFGVTINRATITIPYEFPDDYRDMSYFPQVLNPTMRISKKDTVSYAGLTDASVSSENQGAIDRSVNCYHPDISHHMQQIMATNPNTPKGRDSLLREDIWFLILANEVIVENNSSTSSSDYYSQMAYLNYYNSMLGGYGGYGGYGSYGGYGYDNYYNYYMMQAMYSSMYSSSSTTSTATMLDTDRYYRAFLRGPGYDDSGKEGGLPRLTVSYSFLKGGEK